MTGRRCLTSVRNVSHVPGTIRLRSIRLTHRHLWTNRHTSVTPGSDPSFRDTARRWTNRHALVTRGSDPSYRDTARRWTNRHTLVTRGVRPNKVGRVPVGRVR